MIRIVPAGLKNYFLLAKVALHTLPDLGFLAFDFLLVKGLLRPPDCRQGETAATGWDFFKTFPSYALWTYFPPASLVGLFLGLGFLLGFALAAGGLHDQPSDPPVRG